MRAFTDDRLFRLGRCELAVWRAHHALDQRRARRTDQSGCNLPQDALDGARLVLGLLVDPHGHRRKLLSQPYRQLIRKGAKVVDGQIVEAIAQGRPVCAAVDEERNARQREHAEPDGGDATVAHGVRGGAPFQLGQVAVHALTGLFYLPFDFTRRSAHSLFSFKLSTVRGGSRICMRALPTTTSSSPMTA